MIDPYFPNKLVVTPVWRAASFVSLVVLAAAFVVGAVGQLVVVA